MKAATFPEVEAPLDLVEVDEPDSAYPERTVAAQAAGRLMTELAGDPEAISDAIGLMAFVVVREHCHSCAAEFALDLQGFALDAAEWVHGAEPSPVAGTGDPSS